MRFCKLGNGSALLFHANQLEVYFS